MGDGCRLNRAAYQRLVDENLKWLREQRRTLEREHIERIVEASVNLLYPARTPGGLTSEELVVACKNIGFDLSCGACAGVFYTGSGMGAHTCDENQRTPRTLTAERDQYKMNYEALLLCDEVSKELLAHADAERAALRESLANAGELAMACVMWGYAMQEGQRGKCSGCGQRAGHFDGACNNCGYGHK